MGTIVLADEDEEAGEIARSAASRSPPNDWLGVGVAILDDEDGVEGVEEDEDERFLVRSEGGGGGFIA
jgi:hypothetical protein